jgi:hypothetical protein
LIYYLYPKGIELKLLNFKYKLEEKMKNCNMCKFEKRCEGMWKEYIDYFGEDEFIPIKKIIF